jgi:NAD(P) transhydrogenase subunit alpha
MRIGIPKEIFPGEKRVALAPELAEKIQKMGFTLTLEAGAGVPASFSDEEYQKLGVEILPTAEAVWSTSEIIFKVRGPSLDEVKLMKPGTTLISFIWPAQNAELLKALADQKVSVLAMDSVPRISRAQKLDALSSMANIAGYRAVIEAAHHFGRFFTGQITAAGKVPPAKVFVIGAGVAGLAAIGAACGLGAIVRANDTRPEVGDQVKSMGGEFVPVIYEEEGAGVGGYAKVMSPGYQKAQLEVFAKQAKEVDIIITTALIPGRPAPKLITEAMIKTMKSGSVVVDLASEQGGNCELTSPGNVVVRHGVTIIGYADLPSRLARQASTLYSTNLFRMLEELSPKKDGTININMEDEVLRGTTVVKSGEITWPPPAPKLSVAAAVNTPASVAPVVAAKPSGHGKKNIKHSSPLQLALTVIIAGTILALVGSSAPTAFMSHFTVFVLACFVGHMVVWDVTPALHTPLMSVTNAISSIIVLGALLKVSSGNSLVALLSLLAVVFTSVNMVGGFAVTQRMLDMFRK